MLSFSSLGKQLVFIKDVKSLVCTITEMGNPFMDTSGDLLVLDTREVADAAVVDSFQKMKSLGEEQRDKFFQERIINHKVPLNGT